MCKRRTVARLKLYWHITTALILALTISYPAYAHNTDPPHQHRSAAKTDTRSYLPPRVLHLTSRDGLPSNQCLGAIEDPYGQIWILTQNGLCVYNGQGIYRPQSLTPFPANIKSILFDKKGNLWGTYPGGVFRYNGRDIQRFLLPDKLSPLVQVATSIQLLSDTTVMITHSGMVLQDDRFISMQSYNSKAPDLEGKFVTRLDYSGHFMIYDTLRKQYEFYSGDWEKCLTAGSSPGSEIVIRHFDQLPAVTTTNFRWHQGAVKDYGLPVYLLDDECTSLVKVLDKRDDYLIPVTEEAPDLFVRFTNNDRIANCMIKNGDRYELYWDNVPNSTRRIFISSAGEIYFTSDKGLHILCPDEKLRFRMVGTQPPPAPILLVQRIGDQIIPFHEQKRAFIDWKDSELPLTIRMVSMSHGIPVAQYRLNSGDWTTFSCEKPMKLAALHHGNNSIAFRAFDGDENEQGSDISVVSAAIDLPIFDRKVIRTLAVICGILLILLIIWTLYQRLQMRRELRELRSSLYKTQLMTIQSQLNPHFLFNAMLSLQNTIENRSPEEASEQLGKLSAVIQEVLELSHRGDMKGKLTDIFIPLEKELQLLHDYVELENRQREPQFDFHFHMDPSIDPARVKVPPLMIQPFVENAIIHGIPDIDDGVIQVSVETKNDLIQYTIRDNGIGIEAGNSKKKRFKEFKSHGGTILRQRIDLLRSLGYNVELKISNDTPQGTIVQINLPEQL